MYGIWQLMASALFANKRYQARRHDVDAQARDARIVHLFVFYQHHTPEVYEKRPGKVRVFNLDSSHYIQRVEIEYSQVYTLDVSYI